MRALILAVLALCVAVLAWMSLRAEHGQGEVAAAPGRPIAVDEGAVEAGAVHAGGSADAPAPEGVQRAGVGAGAAGDPAPSGEPVRAEAPTAAVADRNPRGNAGAEAPGTDPVLEAGAAALLFGEPARLEAWLAREGLALTAPRRELASAYAHALAGRGDAALAALERAGPALAPAERELALRLAEPGASSPVPVSAVSPLAMAASMAALGDLARAALAAGRSREAATSYSALLLAEIEAPWKADAARLANWSSALAEAQRGHRWNPRGDWPSVRVRVQPGDSLIALRKRAVAANPELLVCTGQIRRANGLSGDTIHPGQDLLVPAEAANVLVDLDAHWVFYRFGDEVAAAWPAGIGGAGSETRVGLYTVGEKTENPMWFPEGRPPVQHGDPQNPLGTRWIAWVDQGRRAGGLGFHGTNDPESVGRNTSQGCVRLRNADVEELFEILPLGARITVQP
jgi:hypothetical protein